MEERTFLRRNRFSVEFEKLGNDIKPYHVRSLSTDGNWLYIWLVNTDEFFAPEFFDNPENHVKDETITVYFLDGLGHKVAKTVYSGVEYGSYDNQSLDYYQENNDTLFWTRLELRFMDVTNELIREHPWEKTFGN